MHEAGNNLGRIILAKRGLRMLARRWYFWNKSAACDGACFANCRLLLDSENSITLMLEKFYIN